MRLPFLVGAFLAAQATALVKLSDIQELTNLTRESREKVVDATAAGGVGGQVVLPWARAGGEDDEEIEDVSFFNFNFAFHLSSWNLDWET